MVATADWVLEQTNSVGIGSILLSGAIETFSSFADGVPAGEVWYSIQDSNGNRETGIGTFDGDATLARTTVQATLIGTVYNDVNPTPIYLSGNAVVSCVFSSASYKDLLDKIVDASALVEVGADDVSYAPAGDPVTVATNVQNALIAHGVAIDENNTDLNARIDAISIEASTYEIVERYFDYTDFDLTPPNTVVTTDAILSTDTNNLDVYVSGVIQRYGIDFDIPSSTTIRIIGKTLGENDYILAKIGVPIVPVTPDPVNAEDVSYTHSATGAVATTVKAKLDRLSMLSDLGAALDGTTDDSADLQQAIDNAYAAGGGRVIVNGPIAILSTVTIKAGVVVDFEWNELKTVIDIDLIYVNQGGQLANCRINLEAITYTHTAVKFVPTTNVQGDRFIPWFNGLAIKFKDYTDGAGTGVEIDGDTYYVQLTQAANLSVRYGGKAVHFHGTGTGGLDYVNGNIITNVVIMDSHYSFYLNEWANGNSFNGVVIERNNGAIVYCAGSQNNWQGVAWDQVPIIVSGSGNNFGIIQTTRYGADITDTGLDNKSYGRGVEQVGNVSTNTLHDYRHGLYEPGRIEFRDFFLGALDPRWTTTLAGNGAVSYGSATFGNATNSKQFLPYIQLTGTGTGSGEVTLNFNGRNIVKATQKPILHCTNYTNANDARITWRWGLWEDSSNHIYVTQDYNLYGDDNIRLVCTSGGVSTTEAISTIASDYISFMTLLCSPASVTLNVGQYQNTSTGDTGKVSRGINVVLGSGLTATITTNIPTAAMEPYIYLKGNTSSNAVVNFFDYQLIASRKAAE